MGAPPKSEVPTIAPNELSDADGLLFGFPTRFGMMAAQFKAFLDATGGLWRTQQLAGKPAGIFYSTGSQGGGQETTASVFFYTTVASLLGFSTHCCLVKFNLKFDFWYAA